MLLLALSPSCMQHKSLKKSNQVVLLLTESRSGMGWVGGSSVGPNKIKDANLIYSIG
jgi:hypothetical protein